MTKKAKENDLILQEKQLRQVFKEVDPSLMETIEMVKKLLPPKKSEEPDYIVSYLGTEKTEVTINPDNSKFKL